MSPALVASADAEAFKQANGSLPGGLTAVSIDHEQVADILTMHELSAVAMPEAWTGRGRVDLFTADNFLRLLEESTPV